MSKYRLKVLIIAHECSPNQGSECAEGWNVVIRLAKYHDVTVLHASGSQFHHNNYNKAINDFLAVNGPIEGLSFVKVDQPWFTKFIARVNTSFKILGPIGLPVLYYWGYNYWQKSAFQKAIKIHKKENFDIVHQLTQIAFREPGYWWKLEIPFFWGPTGGLVVLPKSFYKLLTPKSKVLEIIRKLSVSYHFNYSYRVIKANKKAAVIYAFSVEDAKLLKRRASGKVKLMLDAGASNRVNKFSQEKKDSSIIKGLWCGQLIERKAAIILLKALSLSRVTKEKIQFQIIGKGPLEKILREETKSLGLNNIEWLRHVDHETVFSLMNKADFFVHTSFREATSHVIPEALSTGLPVICHDAYGMSIAIDKSCGIKIPMVSPEDSMNGFHKAIERLVLDEELIAELKIGAKKRALEISWDTMAKTIASDYLEIVNKV